MDTNKAVISFYENKQKVLRKVLDHLNEAEWLMELLMEEEDKAPGGNVDELRELYEMIGSAENAVDSYEDAVQAMVDMAVNT